MVDSVMSFGTETYLILGDDLQEDRPSYILRITTQGDAYTTEIIGSTYEGM